MTHIDDTIYALSSGTLPAGIAVIRISGTDAFKAVEKLVGNVPRSHQASLRTIRSRDGVVLDQGLILTFPAPYSFTGEDCAELQVHGSRAVVKAIFHELEQINCCRVAEAGEFSRRAFEHGKLDLVEIEGLADLISAETEMQRRLAIELGLGNQSSLYMRWAEILTRSRAFIEAELDFADEDDVPGSVSETVWSEMAKLKAEIDLHLLSVRDAEIIRDGFKVVIIGPPNAGKSSLLNALAKRDVAIVTEIEGTTRDIIQIDLDLGGYLIKFYDTAGLRESEDIVELEGIRRAKAAMLDANLILQMSEIDSPAKHTLERAPDVPMLTVGSKLDQHSFSEQYDLCISANTGEGIDQLKNHILGFVQKAWQGGLTPIRDRHYQHLKQASIFIEQAVDGDMLDIRAEFLRSAASSLGRITGRVDVEQPLDVIFSQFCIGK